MGARPSIAVRDGYAFIFNGAINSLFKDNRHTWIRLVIFNAIGFLGSAYVAGLAILGIYLSLFLMKVKQRCSRLSHWGDNRESGLINSRLIRRPKI